MQLVRLADAPALISLKEIVRQLTNEPLILVLYPDSDKSFPMLLPFSRSSCALSAALLMAPKGVQQVVHVACYNTHVLH